MLKAVVFDLDDTLYEEEQFILSGFRQVAQYLEARGIVPKDFWIELRQVYREGIRGHIFDVALSRVGVTPKPELIAEMLHVYRAHMPDIELYPDARQVLDALSGKYTLGLLSDGYAEVQRNKIAALGIQSYFQAIILSDDLGRDYWKPSPVPYQAMLEKLGTAPEQTVYIADNPAKDFVTARKMGWWTVQIKRPRGQYRDIIPEPGHEAHFEITSLLELAALPIGGLDVE